jgi:hypothetical protein
MGADAALQQGFGGSLCYDRASMHEPETLTRVLVGISRRMRRDRALREIGSAAAVSAGIALLYQILASLTALPVPRGAWIGLAAGALILAWGRAARRLAPPVSADTAADLADRRADLADLLKSARWFGRHVGAEPIVRAQMRRAETAAQALQPTRVAPYGWPRSVPLALVLGFAATAWYVIAPTWPNRIADAALVAARGGAPASGRPSPAHDKAGLPDGPPQERGAEAASPTGTSGSGTTTGKAAAAGATGATGGSGAGAVASGGGAMRWNAIQTSLQSLFGGESPNGAPADASGRDAPRFAGAADDVGRARRGSSDDAVALGPQKKLVATGALNLMSKMAEMFKGDDELPTPHGEMARSLRQATLSGDKIDAEADTAKKMSGDGKAAKQDEGAPQSNGPNVPLTPDSMNQGHGDGSGDKPEGNAHLDAGDTPQSPNAAGEGEANRRGGNDNAESKGTGPSDPVKGEKTARLATQLNRSVIKSLPNQNDAKRDAGLDPIYAATRAQQSMLDYRTVAGRAPAGREDAMTGEQVPLAYRPVVRDYFLALKSRDNAK